MVLVRTGRAGIDRLGTGLEGSDGGRGEKRTDKVCPATAGKTRTGVSVHVFQRRETVGMFRTDQERSGESGKSSGGWVRHRSFSAWREGIGESRNGVVGVAGWERLVL